MPFGFLADSGVDVENALEARLEARIAELEALAAERSEQHKRALEEAREVGARAALAERSDAEEKAIGALSCALGEAVSAWRERLDGWAAAAAGLSSAVLQKLFDDVSGRELTALVESAIRKRLALLEAGSVVAIRVSPDDFPDEQRLTAAGALGCSAEILRDPGVESGGCILDLKLGQVDLSLGEQWRRIERLLAAIEGEGEGVGPGA